MGGEKVKWVVVVVVVVFDGDGEELSDDRRSRVVESDFGTRSKKEKY